MKKIYLLSLIIGLFSLPFAISGQILMTTSGSYTQNFNTLNTSGTVTWADNSTITSWYSSQTSLIADAGLSTTATLKSYGTSTASDRALGSVNTNGSGNIAYGVQLQNNSGTTISAITIAFTGEQWRKENNATSDQILFYYKISTTVLTSLDNLNSGWTAVSSLTFNAPIAGATTATTLDGNAAANRTVFSATAIPSLSIPTGSYIVLKWIDQNVSGTDHGVGIDDVAINWTVTPPSTPTFSAGSLTGFGNICVNSTAGPNSFTLAGSNLDGTDVSISGNGAYTFATSSGGSYSNPLTLTAYDGTAPGTIYVKFTPTAAVSYNGNIGISGGGATAINVAASGSGTAPVTPSVSIASSPVAVSGTTTICSGVNVTFTPTPTNGGSPAYRWWKNGIGTGTDLGVSATYSSTGLTNGDIIAAVMTSSLGCVTSATASSNNITLAINPTPSNDLCSNPTILTVNNPATSGSLSCASQTNGTLNKPDVWYKFAAPCSSTAFTITVNFTSGPDIDFEVYPALSCPTTTGGRLVNANVIGGVTETNTYSSYTAGTDYLIRVIDYNSTASTFTISITGNTTLPGTPGTITGAPSVCPGSAQTYSVINDASVTNYTWTLPAGWSGISTVNSMDVTVGTAGGTVQVTATNGCGTSSASTLAVSMLASPTALTAITASNTDVASFTANWNTVPGATGYYVDVYSVSVATDLIISEYVEGSSNNKYIEIFNGTGASVNLANYKLRLYSNGNSTPDQDIALTGTLANGTTIIYKNSSATIYGGTATANAAVNFNGDDAVALYKISPAGNVDIFGRIGEDPGTAWTGGSNSTLDRTLRRNSTISSGVIVNPTSGFPTLATEWTSYPIDNIANLGAHTFSGGFITGYQNIYTTNNFLNVTNLVGGTTYYYVVRADNGSCTSSNSNQISVTTTTCASSPHTVTSVVPASGPANTRVTISGTGFTNVTSLKIGTVAITSFTLLNSTTIVAKIPPDAVSGTINVYNDGCPKASPAFTVLVNSANCGGGSGVSSDLFISEIFDSETGSRGYIELYNGTSAPIDLSAYKLKVYTGATVYVSLTGTITVGGTVVVRIGNTGTNCTGFTYLDRSSVSGFNDNDEIDLYKGSTLVDVALTPNEVGYSMVRNTATGAPSTTYNGSQWTNTTTENCGGLGSVTFSSTPLLTINSSPLDLNGCPGTLIFIVNATANPTPVTSYTWYYNDSSTMSGWQTVSAGLGIAGNLATLTIPANFANLYNYQFYCEVTKTNAAITCTKYSSAAQFSYPTRPYYKANTAIASAGEWTTPASWLMSNDNTNFVAACTYPVAANSNSVQIPASMGIKHSQNVSFNIDQIIIDAGGQLEIGTGNSQSLITILDGNTSGSDLVVNGTLYDRAKSGYGVKMDINGNNVVNAGEGTWSLGTNGTIIKTNLASAGEYRDMYYNGISTIPSTATWIYRHNGDNASATPFPFASSTAATSMYYPNLTLENTINGNTLSSLPSAADINLSDFTLTGANNPVIIQGDFNVGGSGPGNIKFVNANTNALLQVKKDLFIRAGSTLTNDASPNTTVKGTGIDLLGSLIVDGTLNNTGGLTTGLLKFAANSSDQSILGEPSGIITLQDMTNSNIGGSFLNVDKSISIAGILTLSDATTLRLLSGYVNLKSTATATARVAPINTADIMYFPFGIGRFVIERFFPTHRAWRLMTAPVSIGTAATANSFYNSYQAGGNNTAANAGNGTYISGNSPDPSPTGNGLDVTPLNNSSLKTYDVVTNTFKPVPNTRNLKISGNTFSTTGVPDNFGFFMFVRGDRFNNPNWVTPGVPVNVTTLRDTGKLQIKTYTFPATATVNGYTLIGNPYASPVDFTKVLTNGSTFGVANKFWSWDPNLSAVGAYVLFDAVASYAPVKVPASATGSIGQTKIIQSKQAVFVQSSSASTPKVVFREVDKDITNNQSAYRPMNLPTAPMLSANIFYTEGDTAKVLLDGNMVQSAKEFKNEVDFQEDAIKFININENFGIRNGKDVMILERRAPFTENDTINYTLSRTSKRKYQLQFLTEKIDGNNLTGYLEDSYLKTSTPINMAGETWTDFEITGNTASADAGRFRIVFKKAVQFTSINAEMLNDDIAVRWALLNETNMSYHEVERSTDGIHFTIVGTVNSKGNTAKGAYSLLDLHPATGMYYYRIRSVGRYGAIGYSDIVKVKMMKSAEGMYVFPNPVTDEVIRLQLNKSITGVYNTRLLNVAGQEIFKQNISHAGGSSTHEVRPQQKLVSGTYELQVIAPDKKKTVIKVLVP